MGFDLELGRTQVKQMAPPRFSRNNTAIIPYVTVEHELAAGKVGLSFWTRRVGCSNLSSKRLIMTLELYVQNVFGVFKGVGLQFSRQGPFGPAELAAVSFPGKVLHMTPGDAPA